MSKKASLLGEHPDFRKALDRLAALRGVKNVVCGSFSNASHCARPGAVRLVRQHETHLDVRVYGRVGMLNAYVYADRPADVAALLAGVAVADAPAAAKAQAVVTPPATPAPNEALAAVPVAGTSISGALVTITPDIAARMLERNSRNRPLRDAVVQRYAADMAAGRWKPGGCTIKLDVNSVIVNGQHTLWAVIAAGVAIEAFVITGVDPSVVVVEDDHSRRNLADVARIQYPGWSVTAKDAGVANMLRATEYANQHGVSGHPDVTRQDELDYLMKHRPAVEFALGAFSSRGTRRGIVIAPVLAAVARAYYTQDHDMLRRFAVVLQTGLVDAVAENAAVALRNVLLEQSASGAAMSEPRKLEVFRKTERALRAFIDREPIKIVRPVDGELFPLPDEQVRRKRISK